MAENAREVEVRGGVDATGEGQQLLAASFKKATDLGISGSPNWLLNNRFDMNGRNPEAIKKAFCEKNEGVTGCEKTLSSTSDAPAAGGCGGPTAPSVKKAAAKPAPIAKVAPAAKAAPVKAAEKQE